MTFIPSSHDKNNLPAAALAYAAQGKAVFPLRPRGKTPMTPHGLHDARTDSAMTMAWWKQWPEANIGIPTGSDNGFWVLDIDGEEGENSLSHLQSCFGALPQSLECLTGGGRHIYFALPEGVIIKNSASKIAPSLDVRGDGGYVIAPPSIHESGRAYQWSVDSLDSPVFAPDWLLKAVVSEQNSGNKRNHEIDWADIDRTIFQILVLCLLCVQSRHICLFCQ